MPRALLDATVVIGFVDTDDESHDTGVEIVRAVDEGTLPEAIVTNGVLLEVMNYVHERRGQSVATDLLDRLVEGANFHLPHNPKETDVLGRSLFRRYPDLSFGDAMQVAFARLRGLEYVYSFDDDFDGVDSVTRLDTATDPFP